MKKGTKILIGFSLFGFIILGCIVRMIFSPLSLLFPEKKNDEGKYVYGYEDVAQVLVNYYNNLIQSVNAEYRTYDDVEIRGSCNPANMADVIIVYAVEAASSEQDDTDDPSDMTSSSNIKYLKGVFNAMNTYERTTSIEQRENGSVIGSYTIIMNHDSVYFNTDPVYGECLISAEDLETIPLNTVVGFGGGQYRVVGTDASVPRGYVSICDTSANTVPNPLNNTQQDVTFVSTAPVTSLSYTKTTLKYVNHSAKWYKKNVGFTADEEEYYEELVSEKEGILDDIQKYIALIDGGVNEDGAVSTDDGMISIDLGSIQSISASVSQDEFIRIIGTAAVKQYSTSQILPSLTISQAILESGWGSSGLAKYNNFFGMKWRNGCGTASVSFQTWEEDSQGNAYNTTAVFRAFSTVDEGIAGYYQFLTYSRYANLRGVTDWQKACNLIREDGWATDHSYTEKLLRNIALYELYKWDARAGVK